MVATGNFVSNWTISKKPSPLKLLGQINQNLVGSIYRRSAINVANFVLMHQQTWTPQAILVSDWSISLFKQISNSETT
jgi:hypothetical protein